MDSQQSVPSTSHNLAIGEVHFSYTVFFRLSAHARISAQGLFLKVRGGMAGATVMKNS